MQIKDMTESNCNKKIFSFKWEGCFLHLLLFSLVQISLAAGPTSVVEKGFPISEGHYVNVWAPQPEGTTRNDQIWFMTKQSGTNLTMTASISGGCKKCDLTGKDTNYFGIEHPNHWYELKVLFTTRYGASTVKLGDIYFYPRRQNKEKSPSTITIHSTSELYWTKLDPKDEPFFQQSSLECPSGSSGSGIQMKMTSEDGFELDLITLASLGANALLLLVLMVTVCYYKQKVKAEVTLRKSKDDSQKVSYRQSMDPASSITYLQGNQTHISSLNNADTHHYQGEQNRSYQE